jgi:hypothetical protein
MERENHGGTTEEQHLRGCASIDTTDLERQDESARPMLLDAQDSQFDALR